MFGNILSDPFIIVSSDSGGSVYNIYLISW